MPKYLVQGSYTPEGAKGLLKEGGSKRRAAVEELAASFGGKVEAFYYAFGDTDVFVIIDGADTVTAAATSLAVNAAGLVKLKMTPLITAEEMDQAAKKGVKYRPPGT